MLIGCHLSSSKGFLAMGQDALKINANTFQFFTRNPRGTNAKPGDPADAAALCSLMQEHNIPVILAHAPYILNPCSDKPENRTLAVKIMRDDLHRMELLPGNMYNFHPGCHVGQGVDTGIRQITELLNAILTPDQTTRVLLETMAGKGSEIGGNFSELQKILEGVKLEDKVGVCLDTCHVFDAGYDLIADLDGVLQEFDATIGLNKLYAVHLNDSKNPKGSHKDRHAVIGGGNIGMAAMTNIINHPLLANLPFFLETPQDSLDGYAEEISLLRSLRNA